MKSDPRPELQLNLLVLRSYDIDPSSVFYEALGAVFERHSHNNGPVHLAAEIGGVILEIYPARKDDDDVSSPRIGFSVSDPSQTVATLQNLGIEVISQPKNSPWGVRAVVRDFDGRAVELVQQQDQ